MNALTQAIARGHDAAVSRDHADGWAALVFGLVFLSE